jgi:uncharacterized protein
MSMIRVLNRTRNTVLGHRVRLADDLARRLRGFLFRPAPSPGEGILLSPCRAVHMFGVRFPLDVVFISAQGQVVATYRDLGPWGRSALHGSALHALELPAGTIRATGTAVGDVLSWTVVGDAEDVMDPPASARSQDQGSNGAPGSNGATNAAARMRQEYPTPQRVPVQADALAAERRSNQA